MKKILVVGFVFVLLALVAMPTADAQVIVEESFYQYCFYVCDENQFGFWACSTQNQNYCCWECIEYMDSCSSGWVWDACPECAGSGSPGV